MNASPAPCNEICNHCSDCSGLECCDVQRQFCPSSRNTSAINIAKHDRVTNTNTVAYGIRDSFTNRDHNGDAKRFSISHTVSNSCSFANAYRDSFSSSCSHANGARKLVPNDLSSDIGSS
jgi:hypothetical protein